jgi:hypothetical protein
MEALRRVIRRGPYNRYYDKADETEAVFNVFMTLPPSQYTIQEIADRTGIPRRTLSNWRTQVKQQNDWRPTTRRFNSNSRLLDDATELQIATFLRGTFISQGRDLSVNVLRQQILMLVHDLVSTG